MLEIYYLESIYELLQQMVPMMNLFTGILQFLIVTFAVIVLYKLFNLFF